MMKGLKDFVASLNAPEDEPAAEAADQIADDGDSAASGSAAGDSEAADQNANDGDRATSGSAAGDSATSGATAGDSAASEP